LRRPAQRATDQHVDGSHVLGDGGCLPQPDLVERLIESSLQPAFGVQRRAPVAHEDQHARE
jgi:hypothetical protein